VPRAHSGGKGIGIQGYFLSFSKITQKTLKKPTLYENKGFQSAFDVPNILATQGYSDNLWLT